MFHQYRRRLPHMRMTDAIYFVTWSLAADRPNLEATERSVVLDTLRHFEHARYELFAWAVMENHGHVLVRVFEGWTLE